MIDVFVFEMKPVQQAVQHIGSIPERIIGALMNTSIHPAT